MDFQIVFEEHGMEQLETRVFSSCFTLLWLLAGPDEMHQFRMNRVILLQVKPCPQLQERYGLLVPDEVAILVDGEDALHRVAYLLIFVNEFTHLTLALARRGWISGCMIRQSHA